MNCGLCSVLLFTAVAGAPNISVVAPDVSADCHLVPGKYEFDCEVTDLPVLGDIGLDAWANTTTLTLEVDLVYNGERYSLWSLSPADPSICAPIAVVGDVCIRIDNFRWTASDITGNIAIGVGIAGIIKWFELYSFDIPMGGGPSPPAPASHAAIRYAKNQQMCLDLPGGDTRNGNKLWLWNCNGGIHQDWVFASGSWQIRYKADQSKCVDVPGGDYHNGNVLQIWDCTNVPGQRWGYDSKMRTIYAASSAANESDVGKGRARPNAHKCMDLKGGSMLDGTPVEIWDCNGLDNQRWALG